MSASNDDIRIRIAGDLADINKSLRDLKNQARDAGKEAQRSSGSWGALGKGLDGLKRQVGGLVAAYISFRGVQALFRGIIANTLEAEEVTAQLEARVQSTGGVAGFTARQLLDLAKELQGVSTFGDEAIATMETLLLTFTNVRGTQFEGATRAVLDMAVALKTDLSAAATQVGRALQDPTKGLLALTRAGVTFSAAQRQQIKQFVETNNVAGAQGIILDELTKKFGGAAAAARDTFGGQLSALKEAFGDLLEGGGGAVDDTTQAVKDLVDVLRDPATIAAAASLTTALFSGLAEVTKAIVVVTSLIDQIRLRGAGPQDVDAARARVDELAASLAELQKQSQTKVLGIIPLFANAADAAKRVEQELLDAQSVLHVLETATEAAARRAAEPPEPEPAAAAPVATEIPIDPRTAIKSLQSQLAAAGKILDDELKRVGKALDVEFADNLVRFEDYFKRRSDLERQAIDQQLEAQRAGLALADEEIRLAQERGEETDESENKRKVLVAEITVLERQRGEVAINAARAQFEAERSLTEQLAQVRQRLLELQGNTIASRSLELSAEFEDLLARLAAEGDVAGQELVRSLIDVELARTRLEELQTDYERTLADLARAEKRIAIEVDTGVISEREGRRQIIDLHRETAAELEKLLPLMRELAAASGDPAALEHFKDLELQVEQLGKTADTVAREMKEAFRDAGEDGLSSLLDGTQKGKDAFEDFIQTIRSKIADLISERVFDKLFDGLFGGASAGGAGGGFANFFAGLFHQGGIVGAPGGQGVRMDWPTFLATFGGAPRYHSGGLAGDEVPAILRKGEEVLTANDPRHRANGGGERVTINLNAPDAPRVFRQNRSQLSSDVATMLSRARNRNGG